MSFDAEVHADDPHTDAEAQFRRDQRRAWVLFNRRLDRIEQAQQKPPRWISAYKRDIVYLLLLALSAFGGDVKAVAGVAFGYLTHMTPPVVSPSTAPAPAAQETP